MSGSRERGPPTDEIEEWLRALPIPQIVRAHGSTETTGEVDDPRHANARRMRNVSGEDTRAVCCEPRAAVARVQGVVKVREGVVLTCLGGVELGAVCCL